MAFNYPIAIQMTKDASVLIRDLPDALVQDTLAKKAVPRIRQYFLSAKRANSKNEGESIFFDSIGDLTDSTRINEAENAITQLFDEPTVADTLLQIAANFAASHLINSQVGVVQSQQPIARDLYKQAMADLTELTHGPMLRTALASAVAKVKTATVSTAVDALAYIALDVDPDSMDRTAKTASAYAGAQLPYVGAPEAGKLTAIINGMAFEVTINEGDLPVHAMQKLVLAFEGVPLASRPNVSLAPGEVEGSSSTRTLPYVDLATSANTVGSFSYVSNIAKLAVLPRDYDNTLDVAVMTLSLTSRDPDNTSQFIQGVKGFIYGTSEKTSLMTFYGPHAAAADLHTGKTAVISTPTSSDTATPVSDSLFFELNGVTATAADGELTYRVNDGTTQTVPVPAGATALQVVEAFAQDLGSKAVTQRVLGAIRPSSKITVNGVVKEAPSLEMVAFGIEKALSRMVVTVLSVPAGVIFGVVPKTLITQATFDAAAKSVVVATTISRIATNSTGATTTVDPTIDVKLVQLNPASPSMQTILDMYQNRR